MPKSVVIAGMGGALICRILDEGEEVINRVEELILSPHSEIPEVRERLYSLGFHIADEQMVWDEGKYYVVIKAVPGKRELPDRLQLLYGPVLTEQKNPVLQEYLKKEYDTCNKILENMQTNGGDGARAKMEDILSRRNDISTILNLLG